MKKYSAAVVEELLCVLMEVKDRFLSQTALQPSNAISALAKSRLPRAFDLDYG
jgi:hypothetical protein